MTPPADLQATSRPSNLTGPVVRSSNLRFFLARAEQARNEADAATLDHVKERCLRSLEAWMALASKAESNEQFRANEAKRKAESAA